MSLGGRRGPVVVVVSALDPTLRAEAHSGGREGLPHPLWVLLRRRPPSLLVRR